MYLIRNKFARNAAQFGVVALTGFASLIIGGVSRQHLENTITNSFSDAAIVYNSKDYSEQLKSQEVIKVRKITQERVKSINQASVNTMILTIVVGVILMGVVSVEITPTTGEQQD